MKQPKIPVKMLTTLTILMVFLCVGSYLLSPKWLAVRAEYQRQRDPLHQFASQQTPEAQLQVLLRLHEGPVHQHVQLLQQLPAVCPHLPGG